MFKKKKDMNGMSQEDKNTQPGSSQETDFSHLPEEEVLRQAAQTAGASDTDESEPQPSDADKKSETDMQTDNATVAGDAGEGCGSGASSDDAGSNARKHDKKRKDNDADTAIQGLGEKLTALNDKYVRLYSEYENYRKRTNQEKADLLLNGGKDVLKAILPIVDDMERALTNIPDDNIAKEGVQLVYNKLKTTLAQKGVKEIEAKGQKFDENLHEAVTRVPATEEALKGIVMDVVEKGYMLNDKVLRFPKVVVGC